MAVAPSPGPGMSSCWRKAVLTGQVVPRVLRVAWSLAPQHQQSAAGRSNVGDSVGGA